MHSRCLSELAALVERQGYALAPGLVPNALLQRLLAAVSCLPDDPAVRRRGQIAFGVRNLETLVPEVAELPAAPPVGEAVTAVLGADAFLVRALLFDKNPDANWNVGWHQDTTIAVRERREAPSFRGWRVLAGRQHVQPPDDVLAGMVAARLHLDACGPDDGPLRVIPGSHARGRLSDAEIREWSDGVPPYEVVANAGEIFLMRPLLLHASSSAVHPSHRRVIHLEFAAAALPGGLEWGQMHPSSTASSSPAPRGRGSEGCTGGAEPGCGGAKSPQFGTR